MPLSAENTQLGQTIKSNVVGAPDTKKVFRVHWTKTPIAAATTTLLAATASASGLNQAPTTTVLDVCRNVTATTTGTGGTSSRCRWS
jgi:hypothetical protein